MRTVSAGVHSEFIMVAHRVGGSGGGDGGGSGGDPTAAAAAAAAAVAYEVIAPNLKTKNEHGKNVQ